MISETRTFTVLAMLLLMPNIGLAHEGATGPVGERMQAMTEMGRALKALHVAAKRRELIGNLEMEQKIELLQQKAFVLPDLFAEEAMLPMSDALPIIWEDPGQFGVAATYFHGLVETLQGAHESGDRPATLEALGAVTRACGDCHQSFRD